MISVIPVRNNFYKKALTFIELVLVLIIIVILSAAAIPRIRKTLDNLALENFAKDIYYLSRYLSSGAVSQGKVHYLDIDQEKGEFRALYKEEDEFKKIPGRFGNAYKAPQGVTVYFKNTQGELMAQEGGVYFYPDGSADEAVVGFKNSDNRELSLVIKGRGSDIRIK